MQVAPNYIIAKIDKKARTKRREVMEINAGTFSPILAHAPNTRLEIYLSEPHIFMTRNLQYGKITQIGSKAASFFPEASIGDTIMFHHTVEDDDSDSSRLLYEDNDGFEYRTLKAAVFNDVKGRSVLCDFDIYGFIKSDGTLVPANQHIFLKPETTPYLQEIKSSIITLEGSHAEVNEEQLRKHLEQLTDRSEQLKRNLNAVRTDKHKATEIAQVLDGIYHERRVITMELNKTKLHVADVVAISQEAYKETGIEPGNKILVEKPYLYELEVMDTHYLLIPQMNAVAILN